LKKVPGYAKLLLPPVIFNWLKASTIKYGWFGDYSSWQSACASLSASGYSSQNIALKVHEGALMVKNGLKAYERDSAVFDQIEYYYPVATYLLYIAQLNKNNLHVLDFGGALGSSYYQNRGLLAHSILTWSIVEQGHMVRLGKQDFENDELKFFYTIEEAISNKQAHVALLSCVLPYLEQPYEIIEKLASNGIEYLIIDRNYFIARKKERITVQKVDPAIYEANYTARFFNETQFDLQLQAHYSIIEKFDCNVSCNITNSYFKGYFCKLKI
jgi:putative methyltransferase (TIGR04325 family)